MKRAERVVAIETIQEPQDPSTKEEKITSRFLQI